MAKSDLRIDRALQNLNFSNWRLGYGIVKSKNEVALPGTVAATDCGEVDYLHTRASVLRNHLVQSQDRLFVFSKQDQQGSSQIGILELVPPLSQDAQYSLVQVAGNVS